MSAYRTNPRAEEKIPRDWSWAIKASIYILAILLAFGLNALVALGLQFVVAGFLGVQATFWHYYVALCLIQFFRMSHNYAKDHK